jgi:CBS domain-containing protein
MKVSEIMVAPPVTVDADASVMQVARVLLEQRLPGVPVVDKQGNLLGVVTEADLIVRNANLHFPRFLTFIDSLMPTGGVREFEAELRRMLATSAREVMSDRLVTIGQDADVADAATMMLDKHANPLPVLEDGTLVGTISRTDLVRLMLLEEDESAGRLAPTE